MEYRRIIVLSLFVLLPAIPTFSATDISARKTVEEYVQNQFIADKDDMLQDEYAKYTKLTPALKEHVVDGVLYDFRHDPYVVVNSYKILKIEIDEQRRRGSARIEYDRIGRGETYRHKNSPHTKLIPEPEAKEIVNLVLTFDGRKWYIMDPGMPHVSCSAMKRIYSEYQAERKKDQERFAKVRGETPSTSSKKVGYSDRIRADYSAIDGLSCK